MASNVYVISEKNLVAILRQHELDSNSQFTTVEDALASVVGSTHWKLHTRLEQYGIDSTMRRAWVRRNAKQRCRRGRIGESRNLSWDAWQLVVRQAAPLRVLMLSMTCKTLRDQIWGDHMLWRRLFIQWEMRSTVSFDLHYGIYRPPDVPVRGWQLLEIPDKAQFNAMARKTIALRHTPCCGMCGQVRRKTDQVFFSSICSCVFSCVCSYVFSCVCSCRCVCCDKMVLSRCGRYTCESAATVGVEI